MIKTSESVSGLFATVSSTGALTPATGTPAGTVYINGSAGTAVSVSGTTNPYTWTATMPTLAAGDVVQVYITATISSVATGGIVWSETADTKRVSDLADFNPTTATVTPSGGTVTALTNPVSVTFGTVTAITNPVTVSAGTVGVATSVTNPVAVSGGTVSVSAGTVTSITNPVTVSAGTVTAVTDPVAVSGGTVTAGTVSDKTGYSLTAGTGLGNQTANITGNLSGSVGSVTGNVGGSVASVTAGVTLADDAITAAKYDETTAFPLKSADTGATSVARTGADSDTLETLSDQIDGIAAAGDPWITALPGAYTAGQAGYILGTNLDAQISTIGGAVGSGATAYTVTVNDENGAPLDGAEVWVTSDLAGTSVIAGTLSTNASGQATFMLDAGTYYLWRQLSRYNFTNPLTITVT